MSDSAKYGNWEVVKRIGQGGQGRVYLVRDTIALPNTQERAKSLLAAVEPFFVPDTDNRRLEAASQLAEEIRKITTEPQAALGALKELLPFEDGVAGDEHAALERMKVELSTLEEVNHPSLVKVLDSNLEQKWFVMEYFEGGTLSGRLDTYRGRVLNALKALRPVVDAVSALHTEKVVHRDIKPDNIFVAPDGRLVLADCGLAFKLENQDRLTLSFENVGTREFQPPWSYGQLLKDVQPSFDVFSLAKVLWAMVSGLPRFPLWYFDRNENDLRQLFPDEPAVQFIHEILKKCVVESENEIRLRTAGELLEEVDLAITAVQRGCQLPGQGRPMRCRFCGIGTYTQADNFPIIGNLNTGHARVHLQCNHCGHVEFFIGSLNNKMPPVWNVNS